MPIGFDELCRLVQAFADERYPGHRGGRIVVRMSDGSKLILPIGAASAVRFPESTEDHLTEPQSEIVQALRESPAGERVPVEELARRIGCEPNSRLRDHLAVLVRLGIIRNTRGEGYYVS